MSPRNAPIPDGPFAIPKIDLPESHRLSNQKRAKEFWHALASAASVNAASLKAVPEPVENTNLSVERSAGSPKLAA